MAIFAMRRHNLDGRKGLAKADHLIVPGHYVEIYPLAFFDLLGRLP